MVIKFTVPKRLSCSYLSVGAASVAMLLTFFLSGSIPYGVIMRSKYSISCLLMQHLSELNLRPALHACSTV